MRWLFDTNVFLAMGAVSLGACIQIMGEGPLNLVSLIWVLAYVTAVYNLHGLVSYRQGQLFDLGLRSYYRSRPHRWILGASLVMTFFLILLAPMEMWLVLVTWSIFSMFYGTPILKGKGGRIKLKDLPLIKAPMVAFAVSFGVIWLPLYWSHGEWMLENKFYGALGLLYGHLLLNTLAGDLRDHRVDERHGVPTWPVMFGFERAKWMAVAVTLLIVICGFLFEANGFLLATLILDMALLLTVDTDTRKSYYHGFDALHFFPLLGLALTEPILWA